MASPVFRFPDIMRNLYEAGKFEFSLDVLTKEITMVTGYYKRNTIAEIIRMMKELGFIKDTNTGFMIRSLDGRKMLPEFEKRIEKEAEKELKDYENL